jgi:hypothetical protein
MNKNSHLSVLCSLYSASMLHLNYKFALLYQGIIEINATLQ